LIRGDEVRKLKVSQLEHILGQGWEVYPAGGATGEAFIAIKDGERLFLKRNSSPFLAVLSAEGIVPKLMWTKRLENGDVITAQHWLNGRELSQEEMNGENVANLLRKIHQSQPLLSMSKRMGKTPVEPEMILDHTENILGQEVWKFPPVPQAVQFLRKYVDQVNCDEQAVCHCDVNHNNWMVTETDKLYLIDWDGAVIADPAIDLGTLLYSYIPRAEWKAWLEIYGIFLDDKLELRMKWHVISQLLSEIQWHQEKNRTEEMELLLQKLVQVLN
jgi:thiamine kinase-like enzyme